MRLSEIGEFGFIDRINKGLVVAPERVLLGVGDDAAVVRPEPGSATVLATDAIVENVDFLVDHITPEQLGHKALAVNLSDVAAMGAKPDHALVTIVVPARYSVEYLSAVYDGVRRLARRFGVNVIGGDVSSAPSSLVLSVVVTGSVREDRLVRRAGAREGDALMLAGVVGESGAGLEIILGNRDIPGDFPFEAREALLARHLTPEPLVDEGRWLAETGVVRSMIDVSDGLAADLGHVCRASGAGAEVDEAALPVSAHLRAYAASTAAETLTLVLRGGEDYALLFTMEEREVDALVERFQSQFSTPITRIGTICAGDRPMLRTTSGDLEELSGGFEHFLKEPSDG